MVLDFFSAGLEGYMQKCAGCNSLLDYGTNTKFNRRLLTHTCTTCGEILK